MLPSVWKRMSIRSLSEDAPWWWIARPAPSCDVLLLVVVWWWWWWQAASLTSSHRQVGEDLGLVKGSRPAVRPQGYCHSSRVSSHFWLCVPNLISSIATNIDWTRDQCGAGVSLVLLHSYCWHSQSSVAGCHVWCGGVNDAFLFMSHCCMQINTKYLLCLK